MNTATLNLFGFQVLIKVVKVHTKCEMYKIVDESPIAQRLQLHVLPR